MPASAPTWACCTSFTAIQTIDATLRPDTPRGSVWHRYQGDSYGEHADGTPFDGRGIGRAWPLLTGERGVYTLLAGGDAASYLEALNTMAGSAQLIPEQVWESTGLPTGSARPLVWAHAEYIILAKALLTGVVDDLPARQLPSR